MSKGFGFSDKEKNTPIDPKKTVFRLASISKVFTASAVMQLVEQGKIDLNKDIVNYMGD
ncbi:serine hydrolase [Bacillus paranthracis]